MAALLVTRNNVRPTRILVAYSRGDNMRLAPRYLGGALVIALLLAGGCSSPTADTSEQPAATEAPDSTHESAAAQSRVVELTASGSIEGDTLMQTAQVPWPQNVFVGNSQAKRVELIRRSGCWPTS